MRPAPAAAGASSRPAAASPRAWATSPTRRLSPPGARGPGSGDCSRRPRSVAVGRAFPAPPSRGGASSASCTSATAGSAAWRSRRPSSVRLTSIERRSSGLRSRLTRPRSSSLRTTTATVLRSSAVCPPRVIWSIAPFSSRAQRMMYCSWVSSKASHLRRKIATLIWWQRRSRLPGRALAVERAPSRGSRDGAAWGSGVCMGAAGCWRAGADMGRAPALRVDRQDVSYHPGAVPSGRR